MVTKPTALVLGAGASAPYGFPTGEVLRRLIIEALDPSRDNREWLDPLDRLGIAAGDAFAFRDAFRKSGQRSIDAFLEFRPEFREVGKASIALALIPYENENRLYDGATGEWYDYLWHELSASPEKFLENRIGIVTFNYDRSLEQFLYNALKESYGLSEVDASDILKRFPIEHVYGRLGMLPWQGVPSRAYRPEISREAIHVAQSQIRIVSEQVAEEAHLSSAKAILAGAEQILFLGCRFHPTSMQRLMFESWSSTRRLATAYGLGKSEVAEVESNWGVSCVQGGWDVAGFLKNEVRFR